MATPRMVTAAGSAWPERYTFSPALRIGNLLFISGTTAVADDGTLVAPGDIVGQTRYIYQKFAKLLANLPVAAGLRGLTAARTFDGPINAALFEDWLETCLVPNAHARRDGRDGQSPRAQGTAGRATDQGGGRGVAISPSLQS